LTVTASVDDSRDAGLAQVMVGAALLALRARDSSGAREVPETPFAMWVESSATFAWELLGAVLAGDAAGMCPIESSAEFRSLASRYVWLAEGEFPGLRNQAGSALESKAAAELGLVVTELRQALPSVAKALRPESFDERRDTHQVVAALAARVARALAQSGYSSLQVLFAPERHEAAAVLFGAFWMNLARELRADVDASHHFEGLARGASALTVTNQYVNALFELCDSHQSARSRSGVVPAAAPRASAAPSSPRAPDENVQFSVYRPRVIASGRWVTLLAFAHLAEKRADAAADEPEPLEQVEREAADALKGDLSSFQRLVEDTRHAIPADGEITFVPLVPGIEFNPPKLGIQWTESVHQARFRMRASAATEGKTVRGDLSVYCGVLLVADLQLSITVDSKRARAKNADSALARDGKAVSRYGNIFASYSHADAEMVARIQDGARTLGHDYLMDAVSLRAGERWNEALQALIERADVFQLFWSSQSMHSEFVQREWQYALSLKRKNFVRPTYWEVPMPRSDNPALPPPELADLHFYQLAPGHAASTRTTGFAARALAIAASTIGGLGLIAAIGTAVLQMTATGAHPGLATAPPVLAESPPAPPQATSLAPTTGLTPDTVASPEPPESTSTIKRDEVRAPPIKPGQSGPVGANGTSHPDASRIDQVRVLQPEVVRRCDAVYRRAPSATSPSRVTVTIEVVPTGAVHVLEVSGSDSALSACVVSQVSAWRLAHARATEHVRIAFRFTGNAAPREDVDIGF